MFEDLRRRDAVEVPEEIGDLLRRRQPLFAGHVELDAVAGRQQHDLQAGKGLAQLGDRPAGLSLAEGEPLADRKRRIAMAAPDHLEAHAQGLPWETELWPCDPRRPRRSPCPLSINSPMPRAITRKRKLTTVM